MTSNSQINELHERIKALKEAGMEALMALRDIGCDRAAATSQTCDEIAYVINRNFDTGKTLDERLEEAHDKLQSVLKFEYELEE